MPLALSFMSTLLFPRGGAGTDLVVGAVAAGLVAGRGIEAARADAGRGGFDRLDRLVEVLLGRRVAAREPRLEEAQFHAHRQSARHLPLRERVHLELQA